MLEIFREGNENIVLYVRVCFENNFLIFEYYENILNTVYLIFQGYLWIF